MRKAVIVGLLSCVAMIFGANLARAQDDRRAEAKEFFRAGEQSYTASQYGVAAQAFEEAYSILPVPAIAFSAAQAYRLQFFIDKDPKDLKRAIELYRIYVAQVEQAGRREDAAISLSELEPILSRLEAQQVQSGQGPLESAVESTRTHIMITSSVRGAVVRIDDGEETPVPMDKDVPAGEYRVHVTADGYFPYDEVRKVSEGQFHLVPVQLSERPARLLFRGASGASVSVDGRPVGVLPMRRPVEVSPGTHIVSVGERGHRTWSREISVTRGEDLKLEPALRSTGQRKASYAVGASSLVALGVGGLYLAFAASSNGDAKELEQKRLDAGLSPEEFGTYQRAIADRDSELGVGIGFAAAGGMLAVAGGLLYLVDMPGLGATSEARSSDPGPGGDDGFTPIALVPTISTGSSGLALRGRF